MNEAPPVDIHALPEPQRDSYIAVVSGSRGPGFHRAGDGAFVYDHSTTIVGWRDSSLTDIIVATGGSWQGRDTGTSVFQIAPDGTTEDVTPAQKDSA